MERDPDEPREYGRLIVITGFDVVNVTVEGEAYPRDSMQGVLLVAGEQYEVSFETGESSSSSSSSSARRRSSSDTSTGGQGRSISIRLDPGETRVLMANAGTGTTSNSSASRRQRTPSRRERASSRTQDEDEDEDETGYLGVSSSPRGQVWVDGDNIGQTTPARRIEMEPGRHEVRIFYESEDEFSETKNVLIRAGVNTNVFFRYRPDNDDED